MNARGAAALRRLPRAVDRGYAGVMADMVDPAFALFVYCSYLIAALTIAVLGASEIAVTAVAACGFSCVVFEIALTAWRRARSR